MIFTVDTVTSVVPPRRKYPADTAPSANFLRASMCSAMSFWNTGHILRRRAKMYVSSGPQPRLCTSVTTSSVKRIIASSGMTGGAGSIALLMNVYE